jgi:farnesyl-diphosphate farnesyltransferase
MPEHQILDTSSWSDTAYQGHILQGVSRTFALTIPQLPPALEPAVSNGYLLCRIADTIEDASELTAEQKQLFSAEFIQVVRGTAPAAEFAHQLTALLGPETPAAERDLIHNTERVIRINRSLTTQQQFALSRCVTIMLEGMAYFQTVSSGDGLEDLASFNSYCYHVAGVVGEMLTDLYCDYNETIREHRETMMPLAVSFGQGLQMTNILKDIWNDHSRAACWLPQSLMLKHGINPQQLAQSRGTPEFCAMLEELLALAHAHLYNALRYTTMIPRKETGLRRFCLWAIGMALLTLQRLHQNPGFRNSDEVKISRRSVKVTMLLCNTFTQWDYGLQCLFRLAARNLPTAPPMAPIDQAMSAERLRVTYTLPTSQPRSVSQASAGTATEQNDRLAGSEAIFGESSLGRQEPLSRVTY